MDPRKTYYGFQMLFACGETFVVAAYTPFLRSIGLSLSDIAVLNVWYWVTVILAELPTGLLADSRGRGWSLKMGIIFHALGTLTYFAAQGFRTALLAEVVIGIGNAFLSGATQAWITDALHRHGSSDKVRHVFATGAAIAGVSALVGGAIGALVSGWSFRIPYLMNTVFFCGLLWFVRGRLGEHGEAFDRITEWEALRRSRKALADRPVLKWGIAAAVILPIVVPFNHYWALYFRDFVGQVGLGAVWALIRVSVTVSGLLIRRSSVAQGNESVWIVGALLCAGIGLAGFGLTGGLVMALIFVALHEIGRGAFDPLLSSFTQHHIESSYRATYGSLQSFCNSIGVAITLVVVWWGTRGLPNTADTMLAVLLWCGVVIVALSIILWLMRPRENG